MNKHLPAMMTRNTDAAPMRSGFGFPQRLLRLAQSLPLLLLVLIFRGLCAEKEIAGRHFIALAHDWRDEFYGFSALCCGPRDRHL